VPKKSLPRRPALQILFKPDDDPRQVPQTKPQSGAQSVGATATGTSVSSVDSHIHLPRAVKDGQINHHETDAPSLFGAVHSAQAPSSPPSSHEYPPYPSSSSGASAKTYPRVNVNNTSGAHQAPNSDLLPDSFAPLLSSSQTELILNQLTPDLLHGLELRATANLRPGTHIIPLNKTPLKKTKLNGQSRGESPPPRPQLTIYSKRPDNNTGPSASSPRSASAGRRKSNQGGPSTKATSSSSTPNNNSDNAGCTIACRVHVGSGNGFTLQDDLNVMKPTTERSWTMVKQAEINLSPALALSNVAPTLLHLPSLFEDTSHKWLTKLLRLKNEEEQNDASFTGRDRPKYRHYLLFYMHQVARKYIHLSVAFVVSLSSVLETVLWWIETKCHIHLSKVKVEPIYRHVVAESLLDSGKGDLDQSSKCWRLRLSFSGHVVLWDWIPIPFVNVALPTFIIPAPHAFLKHLLSTQPLASARLRHENLPHEDVVMALLDACQSWNVDMSAVATPPAFSVDVTLPGGMTVAVETMLGKDSGTTSNSAAITSGGLGSDRMDGSTTSMREEAGDSSFMNQRPTSSYNGAGHDAHSVSTWGDDVSDNVGGGGGGDRSPPPLSSGLRASSLNMPSGTGGGLPVSSQQPGVKAFDANKLVPWLLEASVHGSIDPDRVSVNISHITASHSSWDKVGNKQSSCQVSLSGSCGIQRADPEVLQANAALYYPELDLGGPPSAPNSRRPSANGTLNSSDWMPKKPYRESPSVGAIMLFPDLVAASSKAERLKQLLRYEYSFDIADHTNLDAISVSLGVTHPMLKGATIITTVLESVYLNGTIASHKEEHSSILNPFAPTRKRNLLRHIPATDVTIGINNAFIPEQALCFIDDGNSAIVPEMRGGKMTVRALGGFLARQQQQQQQQPRSMRSSLLCNNRATSGIKLIGDFGIGHFALRNETKMNEFPELEIFEGDKLVSSTLGTCHGRMILHLRPHSHFGVLQEEEDEGEPNGDSETLNQRGGGPIEQDREGERSSFINHKISLLDRHNLLDSYEIGFSGSFVSLKLKEMVATLGHRRVIVPSESTIKIQVIESVVNMAFGKCIFVL
jgi:hypothetical protein